MWSIKAGESLQDVGIEREEGGEHRAKSSMMSLQGQCLWYNRSTFLFFGQPEGEPAESKEREVEELKGARDLALELPLKATDLWAALSGDCTPIHT